MKVYILVIFVFFLLSGNSFGSDEIRLSGYIKEKHTNEVIGGVTVKVEEQNTAVQTNNYGFFSIRVRRGELQHVRISAVGYQTSIHKLTVSRDTLISMFMELDVLDLNEVKVLAQNDLESGKAQMSVTRLTGQQIKQMPLFFGEKDLMKALQLIPGVRQGNEGSSNIYVRGGGDGQNLLLLDEAVVYNANHLFGFFSTFNADPVKYVDLYKGGFPANYGGRLSSVIDVRMKEGDKQQFHGEGGVGLISSRLTLEGPIIKNKASFLLSGRRTYADILAKPFQSQKFEVGYYFYDINAKINVDLDKKNSMFLSFYTGKDRLYTQDIVPRRAGNIVNRIGVGWGNITGTLRWNKVFNQKFFSNTSLIYTKYNFRLFDHIKRDYLSPPTVKNLDFFSSLEDYTFKTDFDFFPWKEGQVKFGYTHTFHRFSPRRLQYYSSDSLDQSFENNVNLISNQEGAIYLQTENKTKFFSSNIGLRLSYFYMENKLVARPEPRLLFTFPLLRQSAFKVSYARMNQYLHLLSNTGIGLPTDLWVPATSQIKPASSDQISAGFVRDFKTGYTLTVEAYYKWLKNVIHYKDGANFLGIREGVHSSPFLWEESVTQGKGWAYGYELMARKNTGKLTGFAGYTLSWAIQKFEELNDGKAFYAKQDRRHDLELTGSYRLSDKIRVSANGVFATGNALSIPRGLYFREDFGTTHLYDYGRQNAYRAEPYHRVDLGIQFIKKKKWGERNIDLSIYNIYFRKNPYSYTVQPSYNFADKSAVLNIRRSWLLPIVPSVSYNFKF